MNNDTLKAIAAVNLLWGWKKSEELAKHLGPDTFDTDHEWTDWKEYLSSLCWAAGIPKAEYRKPENRGRRIVSFQQAKDMASLVAEGLSYEEAGKKYGFSRMTAYNNVKAVLNGSTW